MEVILKGNELILKHRLKANETYKIQKSKRAYSLHIFQKPQLCSGYSSRTEEGMHILMLDYDSIEKGVVISEIRALQGLFRLPPMYLLTTKLTKENGEEIGNFHAIALSKHTSAEIFTIMKYTSIDANFQDSPLRSKYRSWVLRCGSKKGSGDPKFLELVGEGNLDREISRAHMVLLSKLYPKLKHPDYINIDSSKVVRLQKYETK